jgi:DNA polymerase-3 subunit epsilon
MRATGQLVRYPNQGFLRLGELYQRLFHEPLRDAHDALVDARATARCFFAMQKQGLITEETVARQGPLGLPAAPPTAPRGKRPKVGLAAWLLLSGLVLVLLAFFLIG